MHARHPPGPGGKAGTSDEVLAAYPYLEQQDIRDALAYAAWRFGRAGNPAGPIVKLLLDMNLSPDLAAGIGAAGHEVIHWSTVGDHRATDATIL